MSDAGGTCEQSPDEASRARADSALAPGAPLPGMGSWVLERKLGGGGFGEVWLARHEWKLKEPPRAVKFCTEPTFRHRLVTHEKNVVRRVMTAVGQHPNIVPLLEHGLDGEIPWLMYEYVEGGTLAELMERWTAYPPSKRLARAVRMLHPVAGALAGCHRLSPPLVHRDLKPQNVLMAGKVPRITDFGIGGVAVADGAAAGATAMEARVPTMMRGSGTRLYAPPEQLFGDAPSPREDVYALGVIAYQMIAGDLATGPGADARDELRDRKVPAELADLVVRSVAMDPTRRPADATEWEAVLGAFLPRVRSSRDSGADSSSLIPAVAPTPRTPSQTVDEPPERIAKLLAALRTSDQSTDRLRSLLRAGVAVVVLVAVVVAVVLLATSRR
jgi:serine/threonine protein kinase